MRNMIVANASFETRASFGVGDFAYSALERDGWFSAPGFSVLSLRAHEYAPSFSLPVPTAADQDGVLLSLTCRGEARHSFRGGTASLTYPGEARHYFGGGTASLTYPGEARHYFGGGAASLSVVKHNFGGGLVLFAKSCDFVGDVLSAAITCRCEARHYLAGACTLTVTAPWFRTHARFSYTTYKSPCRRESRHGFASACTLPKFGRTLRL